MGFELISLFLFKTVRCCSVFSVLLVHFGQDSLAADPKKKITYEEHVLPIFKDKCLNCHGQDKKRGGLTLHTYVNAMQGGSSGPAILPGDPEKSLLYRLMSHTQAPELPPTSPKLPDET